MESPTEIEPLLMRDAEPCYIALLIPHDGLGTGRREDSDFNYR